jgi:DNA polymerase-4
MSRSVVPPTSGNVAFFASIEQHDNPELRGKPVLVGSPRPRGVVTAASYEARRFGCRSAQPVSVARRLCPRAVIVPPRGRRYREASAAVFEILHSEVPVVEPLSVDEAFLDLTGCERALGPAVEVAERLRRRIREDLGLTASVGVAPNKFLAKLASDMDKPDGLTVIRAEEVDAVLGPLPIERMWGVGPATAARLHRRGIRTFADLRALPVERLHRDFGAAGEHYARLARGRDRRAVIPDSRAKSIGHECTFEADLTDPDDVRDVLLSQSAQVARRLRRHALRARVVTVKIRYGDFETVTRSRTLPAPTDLTDDVAAVARALFDAWTSRSFRPVRLIGVSAGRLQEAGAQLELFADKGTERKRRLDRAVDDIQDRFGSRVIRRGGRPRR